MFMEQNFPRKSKIAVFIAGLLVAMLVVFVVLLIPMNRARQAQFTVDALGRFIEAYQILMQREVMSIEDLPDFLLISRNEGFKLRSTDLKSGYFGGYIYDFESIGEGQFVISASPLGLFSPKKELGITHEGILRVNELNVDGQPDGFDEVGSWQPIERSLSIRTQWEPNY